MYCISFNDIIELNGLLKDQGLHFRIHLLDACGKQFLLDRTAWELCM